MAVSKRTRFEVLRRDRHTCQYCGETAPNVTLHVDHVMPTALGGSDFPENLVTACSDCNSGKTSITPDSPIVEQVKGAAADFAIRSSQAAAILRAEYEDSEDYVDQFDDRWNAWVFGRAETNAPLPPDWRDSVRQWWKIGVPGELVYTAIDITMGKRNLQGDYGRFRYMAGIVWSKLERAGIGVETSEEPRLYTSMDLDKHRADAYEEGFNKGRLKGMETAFESSDKFNDAVDFVARHADGRATLGCFPSLLPGHGGVLSGA